MWRALVKTEVELPSGAENLSENNFDQHELFEQVVMLIRGYSSRESEMVYKIYGELSI